LSIYRLLIKLIFLLIFNDLLDSRSMVTIKVQETKLQVSGKTFAHKETLKSLGGRWEHEKKLWEVPNTSENLRVLKGLRQKRNCGYCGCPGHFRPKCDDWLEDQRILELGKAAKKRDNPGWHYKKFSKVRDDCECKIVDRHIKHLDLTVQEPFTCWGCDHYCCSSVEVCEKQAGYFTYERNYRCPIHPKTYQEREHERFMMDSSGT